MKTLLKLYLWPLIKRFKALFITMAVLTTVGVSSIIAFNGISKGVQENYGRYVEQANAPDAFISTGLVNWTVKGTGIEEVEGVRKVEKSIFLPASMVNSKKNETKSCQIFTYNVTDEYKPYIKDVLPEDEKIADVYIENSFAKLNDIKSGDIIKVGYFKKYINVRIMGIVSFPDTVVYGASNSISTENTNFGRLYLEHHQVEHLFTDLINVLKEVADDSAYSEETKKSVEDFLEDLKKFKEYFSEKAQKFANRLAFYFDEDANQKETLERVKSYLQGEEIKIIESYLFADCLSASLIDSSSYAMKYAGAGISIFVFATTIIVLAMFLLQIIREMMRDIGVMSAIGIQKENVMIMLAIFSLIISVIGTALGVFFGHLIEFGLDAVVSNTFSIGVKTPPFRWKSTLLSFALVLIASQIATFFASIKITSLTPVDALNDQASNKKVLPPSIDKKLQHARPLTRLTVNSIVTKPKRFFTSLAAIFSTGLIIFTALASLASFRTAMKDTFVKYIKYDAQVAFADEAGKFEDELVGLREDGKYRVDYEETKYASSTLSFNGNEETVVVQGLSPDTKKITIPTKKNPNARIPDEGITVNMMTAKALKIKEGDTVKLDGHDVKVVYITQLEVYNACFCHIDRIAEYTNNSVRSYLINDVDKESLISLITNYHYDAIVSFTKDQQHYYADKFKTLEMCCIVFIFFAIGLGILIVSLMMQTSLAEQKRDLCIMKSVGFSMGQISGIWSAVTISQFITSMIFSIPLSFVAVKVFLSFAATKTTRVLSHAGFLHVVLTLLIVSGFLLVSQFFCMRRVKKWNIAENTKNRE